MKPRIWPVLALLIAAGPAWGQTVTDEDYDKYARPVIDKFTACERPKIVSWAQRTTDEPSLLVDRAVKECHQHLDELLRVMEAAPFNLSADEARQAIDQMLRDLRPLMLEDIEKAKKA
jgi:hypothetical protein